MGGLVAESAARDHSRSGGRAPSRWKIWYFLQNGLNFRPILNKTTALKRGKAKKLTVQKVNKLVAEMGYVESGYNW